MPLQNRVDPEGQILAVRERGTLMGNRGGALHGDARRLGQRRWVSRQWIACRLAFNNRRRTLMAPGRYTELFFLDEATALAAGHRPCFECRRADFLVFASLWARSIGLSAERASADDMDRQLHAERVGPDGAKVTWRARRAELPDGVIVRWQGTPHLVLGDRLLPWSFGGYGTAAHPPMPGEVEVLTPRTIASVIAAGYPVALHASTGP